MYTRENPPTQDEVLGFFSELSNWGRWGESDERGTLNLIDEAATKRGAASVRHGVSVSCAWEIAVGPGGFERQTNAVKVSAESSSFCGDDDHMGSSGDHLAFGFHGFTFTHVDSLCHYFWDGRM